VAVDNSDLGIDVQCGHCGEVVTVPYSRVTTGAVIADFIILEELGRGGMGIVYLTHQISLDRPAALKVLSDTYANNAEFVVNFIKEARAAAKLNHPHIVQAYAVGEDEGIFYFAMENIDGETMKQVLKRKKVIPVDEAILIIQQIAEALDYAWKEQKLIHRDIKPDNIMITKNGRGKLADLGLSRVAGELDDSDDDEVMGTPQYISPEHLTGAPMDVRSDIYSLGATLFHLITGKFPFEGRTATEIARKHLEEKLVPPH
jgi:serine/threonine protein kinase